MSKQFENLVFKNEPDETTPLSAENLNLIQSNINNVLKNNFGGYSEIEANDINYAINDGIYLIEEDPGKELPFTPNQYDPSWLISLARVQGTSGKISKGDSISQIVIQGGTSNMWIRAGHVAESEGELYFSPVTVNNYWKKLETILPIRTGYVRETNIQIEETGKKVYVKRINGGNLPNTNAISLNTGISESVSMYKIEGVATNPESNNQLPIPFVRPSSAISAYYSKEEKVIYVRTENDRTAYTYYIDFYFTYDD